MLFTDLVGFTEYNDAVGDTAALRVLDSQSEMAGTVVMTRDGARVVKELGDGLMLWFGSAMDGLNGASELMDAIFEARREGTFPLSVRMGLHYGEAVARRDDIVGHTVNIASRVAGLAGPGELLVSEAVIGACGDSRPMGRLSRVGPVVVKGVQEPIWLRRLTVRAR